MSQRERLRFFATLSSIYMSRRQSTALSEWLFRARQVDSGSASWAKLYDDLRVSVGHALDPKLSEFIEEQLQKMDALGVDVVARDDDAYPRHMRRLLADKAPPLLWFRGNSELFHKKSVGFCGSRHASALGLEVCGDIVGQLVERNVVVVAGYAAGVDQVAHLTALKSGGETIAVLAEGILNFSVRQVLAESWQWNRAVVVSEFLPQKRWSVAQAMQRNRTIVGFGRALVVIEAGETGGTFEAGKEALALHHPLFAPIYGSLEDNVAGNKILIGRGATPIMKSRTTNRAKVDALLTLTGAETEKYETHEPRPSYKNQ